MNRVLSGEYPAGSMLRFPALWLAVAFFYFFSSDTCEPEEVAYSVKVTPAATIVEVKKGTVLVRNADGESEIHAGRAVTLANGQTPESTVPRSEFMNDPADEKEQEGSTREQDGRPADPSLFGYWRFDEGEGTSTRDETAYAHHGTVVDAKWVEGRAGTALAFDGVSSRVELGNPRRLQLTGSLTITAWVYVNNFETNGRIICKQGGPGDRGWSLNLEKEGYAAIQIPLNGDDMVSARTPLFPSGMWVHLAGVYDATSRRLYMYLNGKPVDIKTGNVPNMMYNSPLDVRIGARPKNGCFFYGRIDELRVYARPLSMPEVNAVMRGVM